MGSGSLSKLNIINRNSSYHYNNNSNNNKKKKKQVQELHEQEKEEENNVKLMKKQTSLSDRFLNLTLRRKEEKEKLLRLRILDDIKIHFGKSTIIMLFGPPEFPVDDIAEYLSNRVDLPVVKTPNKPKNEEENEGGELMREAYENSIRASQEYENKIMKDIELRLLEPDCQNGCILVNFPQSPKQYSFLCQLNTAEHIPFFFDIDSQTMANLQLKFDRWIHSDTNRSYHALTSPPLSNKVMEKPNSSNMIDDTTGDKLIQLESDSIATYKAKYREYKALEHLMMGRLHHLYYTIPSYSTRTQLYRHLIKLLGQISSQQISPSTTVPTTDNRSTTGAHYELTSPKTEQATGSVEHIRKKLMKS